MATNKNAVLRYHILDECFSNFYRPYFISDLITVCSEKLSAHFGYEETVSRRTVLDDISFMKSEAGYDAPIASLRDGKKVYYRYEDSEFSILKKPLTNKEKEALSEVLQTLSRMKNMPGMDGVETILTKLHAVMDLTLEERRIISFEDNEFLTGIENLGPLYQFIIHKNVLNIYYTSFKSDKSVQIIFSPHFLKQYNGRWFVFGKNHEYGSIQNLALDRIKKFKVAKEKYAGSEVDYEEYFEDIIGVSNDSSQEVVTVKIEMNSQSLPYIATKPLHGSQKIKGNILTLEVKHNPELETLLLSFGERIKILEPQELVESLKRRTAELYQHYL